MPERPPDPALEASTNRWMRTGLVLMALLILAFPAYRLYEPAGRSEALEELDAFKAEYGAELYDVNCAACHGVDALGAIAPALNAKEFLQNANDTQITQLISVGVPGTGMGAYLLDHGGPLTSAQIVAITAYLRSLEPDAPDNPNWRTPLG